MECQNCNFVMPEDSKFCPKCGDKATAKAAVEPEKIEEVKQDITTSGVKKILLGVNLSSGLRIPEKSKLERKVWYRLLRVLFFVSNTLAGLISLGIAAAYYNEETYCYYSTYTATYSGSCGDEGITFFVAILVAAISFYAFFVALNAIRLTFYYIIYGKE